MGRQGSYSHRALRRCAITGEAEERVEDDVRRADPLSVNPGQRPGMEIGVGMHRKAVPL